MSTAAVMRVQRRGRVCSRPSSNGNEGEMDEGHEDERGSGTREGSRRGANRAGRLQFARGRTATSASEEASGGGDGSRGTATTRASCWTRRGARARRTEEGPEQNVAQLASMACQGGGDRVSWQGEEAKGCPEMSSD